MNERIQKDCFREYILVLISFPRSRSIQTPKLVLVMLKASQSGHVATTLSISDLTNKQINKFKLDKLKTDLKIF
jgi:hypothetical protein